MNIELGLIVKIKQRLTNNIIICVITEETSLAVLVESCYEYHGATIDGKPILLAKNEVIETYGKITFKEFEEKYPELLI